MTAKVSIPDGIWTDTHCHLDMTGDNPAEIISRSQANRTPIMVTIGTTHKSNQFIDELVTHQPQVYGTVGYHPHNADDFCSEHLDFVRERMTANPRLVGVGECGLDYYYTLSKPKNQRAVFERFLAFALECDYPLVVHSRNADDDTKRVMQPFLKDGLKAVLHSFTAGMELAEFGWEYGCYFSFNGIATYKKSESVRQVFMQTPSDRVLLETDSPYLSPVPLRGKPNIPGYVGYTGMFLAELKNLSADRFSQTVNQNAANFYRNLPLPPDDL